MRPSRCFVPKFTKRTFSSKKELHFLEVNQTGGVVRVSFNRPKLHNAFNEEVIRELTETFDSINKLLTTTTTGQLPRAVVLSGHGSSFSAGADLNWMKKMVNYSKEENERDSGALFEMILGIKNCHLPVIGRINGPALGGGAGLVAACDFAFAVNSATFGFTEVKLGLIPAVISPFVMAKIGQANCSRYFLTGEKFDATEAKRIGLIQEHFQNEEEMDKKIQGVLHEISISSPAAVTRAKKLIEKVSGMNLQDEQTKKFVASEIAAARVSKEGQDGLSSFLERRKPSWIVPQ
eukprot:TRINITY_DN3711_c0_g1_i1.p1 TRINITY_DN3711_c0_g1~~TRINITY_DN3711_c0_g1_i1.p1  ORF type:complete len:307 (-),score=90.52 TRINITY_DN3711_c0_g1_i1:135-1010(-)